jgi:hypothetical protein
MNIGIAARRGPRAALRIADLELPRVVAARRGDQRSGRGIAAALRLTARHCANADFRVRDSTQPSRAEIRPRFGCCVVDLRLCPRCRPDATGDIVAVQFANYISVVRY